MKELRITVTDEMHDDLDESKGERSWRAAMLEDMVGKDESEYEG